MKKIISLLTTIALIWGILMFIDYVRAYQNDEKLLISLNSETTSEYTLKEGLGYSIKKYNYNKNNLKDGQVLKEFKIFDFVVSKEIARINGS